MFVVPRFVLSLILFLFTFPEFCLLNFLQLSLWMTQFCAILFVCLSFCQNVCAAAWAEELERGGGGGGWEDEQPGKYKQTQQQLHIRLNFPTRQTIESLIQNKRKQKSE